MKKSLNYINLAIVGLSISLGLFHLYTAFFGVLTALWQRSIHLGLGMLIAYLMAINSTEKRWSKILCFFSSLATISVVFYLIYDFDGIIKRFSVPNTTDLIIGTLLIILVLDFTRRIVGLILPGIALIFLLYSFAGPYLPGILWHRGYDLERIVTQLSFSTEGIFGVPLGVSANYIFLFVLFGSLLKVTNISQFYIDFAIKLDTEVILLLLLRQLLPPEVKSCPR